jgi:diguanylate cyclase (GGDEF)-like protein
VPNHAPLKQFFHLGAPIHPARDAAIVSAVLLLTAIVSLFGLYRAAHSATTREIQSSLLRVAEAAASLVDGDLHRAIEQAGREDTPAYAAAVKPLAAVRDRVSGVRFIYTMTLRAGQPCFILDATPPGDADGDRVEDHSALLEPYHDADPALLFALRTGQPAATPLPESDRWGTLVSGYAPIRDSTGTCVGILGVDMTADVYYERLAPVRRAALAGIVPAVIATLVAGGVTFIVRRGALAAEEQLRGCALRDALTGLQNRPAFLAHIEQCIARAQRDPAAHFALLFLDFDRFKLINDSLGHAAGDELLVAVAERLRAVAARHHLGECYLARLGGDEFVILAAGLADAAAAAQFAEGLQLVLSRPYRVAGHNLSTSVSIGIVLSAATPGTPGELLRDADTAMYRAKSTGRACHALFDQQMHADACAALELEKDLAHALARRELHLVYQPIVSLHTGRVAGFEALLRWQHSRRGAIPPDRFISVAEECGLIIPLGEWVLRTSCAQLRRWQRRWGSAAPFLSINLSKKQLMAQSFIARLRRIIADAGVHGPQLKLEVTESVVMGETERMARGLRDLKDLNVQLLIDDFGTGHSSLSRLHEFPIDGIKIDRAFVARLSMNRQLAAILHAILTLARNLNMQVIAEGVETPEQLAQLLALSCDLAQGYYFARPLPLPQAEALFDGAPPWLPIVAADDELAPPLTSPLN